MREAEWMRHSRLSSRCGGDRLVQIPIPAKSASAPITAHTPAKPGHTERPAELQFMVRRVLLYRDNTNLLCRPDSSRPQAARSRVACAKRCGCGHCPPRSGVEAGTARRGAVWMRHSCLSGLSSGTGRARECALRSAAMFVLSMWRFASVHACCLPHGDKQDGLRYAPFLFRRVEIAFVHSRGVGAVICLCGFTSGLAVPLWRSRRSYQGCGGRGNGVTGLAARPLCAFA